ncbi:MAG: phosphonate C-P lyase system protein PhnH [Pseudomonadota bacterium]
MTADGVVFEGGFESPALQAAAAFRAGLEALARPGAVEEIAGCTPPDGLSVAAGALLLSLADADTPLWLPEASDEALKAWLLFHCGAPRTWSRGTASFAVGSWQALMPLTDWAAGTPDYPDRSATLIVELDAMEGGPPLALTGPGIPKEKRIAPALPLDAVEALAANAARFPLGVDLYLTVGERAMGLPRTTRVHRV